MPKIIGGGYEATCGNCGKKQEFTRDEVRPGDQIPGSEERDHDSVITCAGCGKSVRVTSVQGIGATPMEVADRYRAEQDYDY